MSDELSINYRRIESREFAYRVFHLLHKMTGDRLRLFVRPTGYRIERWTGSEWVEN